MRSPRRTRNSSSRKPGPSFNSSRTRSARISWRLPSRSLPNWGAPLMATPSIEDWIAINDLFIRYACNLDHADVEGVVSCFTRDGVIESPVMGKFTGEAGIREFAERNARYRKTGVQLRHVVSNVRIDVELGGTRARAFCYLLDFLTEDGTTQLLSPGEYDCQLVKIEGNWKFQHRLVLMDKQFKIQGM